MEKHILLSLSVLMNLHRHTPIHRPRKPRPRNLRPDAKSKLSRVAEWVSRNNAKTQTLLELPAPQ